MLTLNLLPPEQRKNLNYEIQSRMVQFVGFWFSAIIIIFGVLLLPAFFFVSYEQSGVLHIQKIEEETFQATHAFELEKKIHDVDTLLNIIITREAQKKTVAPFLSKILSQTPVGVSVTLIRYDPPKNSATITGVADTREALLKFIDLLKKSPKIKNVSSPVSNLIQPVNVNFSLGLETQP